MVMIRGYAQPALEQQWLQRFQGRFPRFVCVLGFTETGLLPGISAAGATPADRQFTAIADAEFLYDGPQPHPHHPLPPLQAGASPVLISRAVVAAQQIPVDIFNAGLPQPPTVPHIDLQGVPARCLSQGRALDLAIVQGLLERGLAWGRHLAAQNPDGYLVVGECVVGGTTTALAVLTGLGWAAAGKVNSSHPACNHAQKWEVVSAGLATLDAPSWQGYRVDPLRLLAAVGDPMQIVVAGMAIAASAQCGVLLAGGTQMLAVYALMLALERAYGLTWPRPQVVVGTTRWVAEDPTGDTIGLAQLVGAPLLATQLSFASAHFAALRAYEQGYVKEGVGAGGCGIAAHLYQGWSQRQLLQAIETLADQQAALHPQATTVEG